MRLQVKLPTAESVTAFCAVTSKFPQDVDVRYSKYLLDGKSVAMLSAVSRDEILEVHVNGVDLSKTNLTELCKAFEPFKVTA